ncbi:FGGY-family carbohydrate kinase [Mesobacterium sp. TK19101]|uniref:FGGY-family carbohydrate kinase n=1 Tax=Mesobacterium hydrothermale TaxID=3111907 RepID=A0ABU6HE62_9RHOB|nr:FGGY-family carbohydrate kinase [Mesobacterium sp. TK19101]MEC3860155.1 FGGY-family carbohydrate kinase [Mesobacterium sp. TK19101]
MWTRITGQSAADLTGALGDHLQSPGAVMFHPYLSGERTPHNDATLRGAFTGLSTSTTVADLTRAVLEGVAYALRDCAEALKATGSRFDQILAIGGGSRSDYWLHLLATVLKVRLHRPDGGEFGAALGAARLAICAATGAAPEAVMTAPDTCQIFDPVPELRSAFDDAYERFRTSVPS